MTHDRLHSRELNLRKRPVTREKIPAGYTGCPFPRPLILLESRITIARFPKGKQERIVHIPQTDYIDADIAAHHA